jgi:hypothetical protein
MIGRQPVEYVCKHGPFTAPFRSHLVDIRVAGGVLWRQQVASCSTPTQPWSQHSNGSRAIDATDTALHGRRNRYRLLQSGHSELVPQRSNVSRPLEATARLLHAAKAIVVDSVATGGVWYWQQAARLLQHGKLDLVDSASAGGVLKRQQAASCSTAFGGLQLQHVGHCQQGRLSQAGPHQLETHW